MKKLFCLAICLILTLSCLTGCSGKSGLPEGALKEIWGKSPEQAAAVMGLDLADAAVEQYFESGFSHTYEDVTFFGEECTVIFQFLSTVPGDEEEVMISLLCDFADVDARTRAVERMRKHEDYAKINQKEGFYSLKDLSQAEIDWIEKYTHLHCGEKGWCSAKGTEIDGITYKWKTGYAKEDEWPLVHIMETVNGTRLTIGSSVYPLLATKEKQEARYPNGVPTLEE